MNFVSWICLLCLLPCVGIFLLAIIGIIPDFIVFTKKCIEDVKEAWEDLPRRLL